jgi:succinate dehydrogenase/fumarate reductase flavoprotein subunit
MPAMPSAKELAAMLPSRDFRTDGAKLADLRHALRQSLWEKNGIVRTEHSLLSALDDIGRIRRVVVSGNVEAPEPLTRYHELLNMLDTAEAAVRSALVRKESRGAHFREDFPEQDDAHWLGNVQVRKRGQTIEARFEPIP